MEKLVNASASPTSRVLPVRELLAPMVAVELVFATLRNNWLMRVGPNIPHLGMLKSTSDVFVISEDGDLTAP